MSKILTRRCTNINDFIDLVNNDIVEGIPAPDLVVEHIDIP